VIDSTDGTSYVDDFATASARAADGDGCCRCVE
jgi:hypothetical protein